ncbi:hypothetical protein P1X16_21060 [Hymenobacter sp. YC55]|nr:hypothetical protein [Hymenobacter sp. YC55]MDF7813880.1 hypothetical protein [Hymenobacter sp. YC55]
MTAHYTLLAPESRSCGQSDKPEVGDEVHLLAEDVRPLVRQLGLENVNPIGQDPGSIQA